MAQRVLRWPIREALEACRSRMRMQATESYRHALTMWAALAPHAKDLRQPQMPAILREVDDGHA